MLGGFDRLAFFVWLDVGLAVYPHDDGGLGVVALRDNATTHWLGRQLLRDVVRTTGLDLWDVRDGGHVHVEP